MIRQIENYNHRRRKSIHNSKLRHTKIYLLCCSGSDFQIACAIYHFIILIYRRLSLLGAVILSDLMNLDIGPGGHDKRFPAIWTCCPM